MAKEKVTNPNQFPSVRHDLLFNVIKRHVAHIKIKRVFYIYNAVNSHVCVTILARYEVSNHKGSQIV